MDKDLLPIYSKVFIKNSFDLIWIMGINQVDPKNPNTKYDYIGIPDSESGIIGISPLDLDYYLFNQDDIEQICFIYDENNELTKYLNDYEEKNMNFKEIKKLMESKLKEHELDGCEICEEDVYDAIELTNKMSLNDAVDKVLTDIRKILDEGSEDIDEEND